MTNIDFSRRNDLTELMDSDDTDFETFRACLIDLSKVNLLTLAYRPTLRFFGELARSGRLRPDRTIRVLDVGIGYGDMLRKIDKWASRRGSKLDLTGVDRNPWAVRTATEATASGRPIRFVAADVFDYRPADPVDIIISSLFTHHLDDASLIRFISWMEASATIGWFVNDLHRNAVPYYLFWAFARTMRFHEFVKHDGPVSIARAFDVNDWRRLLDAAAVPAEAADIRRVFPYRLCVSRLKA